MDALEQRTMGKVAWRLVPFLMLCYFFCFLDRVNVGFAALQMNQDLHFTASVFGFGAGIMFVTYMLGEAPSNLVLVKVGPRPWIARIMITWACWPAAWCSSRERTVSISCVHCWGAPRPVSSPVSSII